jgi:hypothetical protein
MDETESPDSPVPPRSPAERRKQSVDVKIKSLDSGFWTTLFAKSGDLFFRFMGLDPIADDIEKHHATMRKVALVRFVIIMAMIVGFSVWGIKGCVDDNRADSLRDDLNQAKDAASKSDGGKLEAERERDKAQIELAQTQTALADAQNALAPWKALANNQYPGEPINKSLDLLLHKVDSISELMKDQPTKEAVQRLSDIADADKEYHDIAMLPATGSSFPVSGDLIYHSPLADAMRNTYTIGPDGITNFKFDASAEKSYREAIKIEPRFPFAYVFLAQILLARGDPAYLDNYKVAEAILKKTTLIPGHNVNHDEVLKSVEAALDARSTLPLLVPDTSVSPH